MKKNGAIIVDPANLEGLGKLRGSEILVMLYEFKADLNAYLARLVPAPVHSLKEIIDFNDRHREKEMPHFGQDLLLKAEATGPLNSPEYLEAIATNHRLSRTRRY